MRRAGPRPLRVLITLVTVVLLLFGARLARTEGYHPGDDATMVLGFILIASYLVGSWMPRLGIPRITGYLLTGALFGPYLLELAGLPSQFALIDKIAIKELELFNHVALGLIAFTAGGELRLTMIKERWQAFTWVTFAQAGTAFLGVGSVLYLGFSWIPGMEAYPASMRVVICAVLACVAVAKSPATTIAVINETRSRGPVTDLALGVTVVKDVVVVVAFAATMAVCRTVVTPQEGATFDPHFLEHIVWEVFGSLILGAVLGALLVFYIRYVKTEFPIVVLVLAFLTVYAAGPLSLSGLLLCLGAGFVVENFSPHGEDFVHAVERYSLPVYVVFFTLAGATIQLPALRTAGVLTLILVGLRLVFTALGNWLGASLAGESRLIRNWGWMAFLGQAGVTLGFALIIRDAFPEFGPQLYTVIVAAVAINQVLGPIAFRYLLVKAGEVREKD